MPMPFPSPDECFPSAGESQSTRLCRLRLVDDVAVLGQHRDHDLAPGTHVRNRRGAPCTGRGEFCDTLRNDVVDGQVVTVARTAAPFPGPYGPGL